MGLLKFLTKLMNSSRIVVEVKTALPTIDKSANESIKTLMFHPGFIELTNRLKIQRAFLETTLKRDPNADMRSLQQGIYWSEYWEREVEAAVNKRSAPHNFVPDVDVMAEFQKINSAIERVS